MGRVRRGDAEGCAWLDEPVAAKRVPLPPWDMLSTARQPQNAASSKQADTQAQFQEPAARSECSRGNVVDRRAKRLTEFDLGC